MPITYEKQSETELKEIYTPPAVEAVYSLEEIDVKIADLAEQISQLAIAQESQMLSIVQEKQKWDTRKEQCLLLSVGTNNP